MDPRELERRTHDALTQLPRPMAPSSLLPKVMATVGARAKRPWYARPWAGWPLGWQVASAVAAAALVVAIGGSSQAMTAWADGVSWPWASATSTWGSRVASAYEARGAAVELWRGVVSPYAVYLVAAVALMWAACAAISVALSRVAFGEAVES